MLGHILPQLIMFPLTGSGRQKTDYLPRRYDTVEYVGRIFIIQINETAFLAEWIVLQQAGYTYGD